MPKISVIIPVYNGAATLRRAVESAQNQTVRDIEIVVVDDGSTDDTKVVLKHMAAADARIKSIKLPVNGGVSNARNTALAMATGEWVALLDADDWYESERLEILLKAAQDFGADIVADNLKIYDHVRGDIVNPTKHGRYDRTMELTAQILFQNDNPLRQNPMGFLQPMIHRQFIIDHKVVYDTGYRVGEDFVFLAELILQGARAIVVPGAYYVYVHRISPTTRKISPYSHSSVSAVFDLFIRGCDELEQKYSSSMTPGARRALRNRRWILEKAAKYRTMRDALSQRRYFQAGWIVVSHPVTLVLVAKIIAEILFANVRFYLRFSSNKSLEQSECRPLNVRS